MLLFHYDEKYALVPCSAISKPADSSFSDTLSPVKDLTNNVIKVAPIKQKTPTINRFILLLSIFLISV